MNNDLRTNGSGISDYVAANAIRHVDRDRERFEKLLSAIFNICEISDFHIEERIVVKDKRTGEIWR